MKPLIFILTFAITLGSFAQNIATINGNSVIINNNVISAEISGGRMTTLNLIGHANILNNGGYGYFSYVDNVGFFSPSTLTPQIKVNNTEIADIYYSIIDNFNVEMHYVFRKNESGFFVYFIVSDIGLSFKTMNSLRFAVRVDKGIFDYAWTTEREGAMIHPDVLANYVEEIQDATYLLQDGTIYTKYDWAVDKIRDDLHGLMGNGAGIWNIEASHEYSNSGPTAQELTLHGTDTTPILLSQFFSNHYGGEIITLKDEYTSWQKIFGPHFIYLNTGTQNEMIADAKQKASELKELWPYTWLNETIYPLNRGTLSGTLKIDGQAEVDSAMVLLSKKAPSWVVGIDPWQKQPYDYMFWTEANKNGDFLISNIRPGTYTLHAYTQKGKLIDDLQLDDININVGENALDAIEWMANDKQKSIFQIGNADHKSGEYNLADLPRAYGRWKDSPYILTYNVNTDNPRDNWYYCQRVGSTWKINFDVTNASMLLDPTLKVAIAGVDAKPHLDVVLNGTTISTTDLGTDSGIRRSSLTGGKYSMITVSVNKELLLEGTNSIEMRCYGSAQEYKGIMYDAILLEADTVDIGTSLKPTISSKKPKILITQTSPGIIQIQTDININAISIIDLTGNKVFHHNYDLRHQFFITDFNKTTGTYIIQLHTPDRIYTQKFCYLN
nr:polysaccharide lyase family protein [uncultured Carboxylicivirga sp.]